MQLNPLLGKDKTQLVPPWQNWACLIHLRYSDTPLTIISTEKPAPSVHTPVGDRESVGHNVNSVHTPVPYQPKCQTTGLVSPQFTTNNSTQLHTQMMRQETLPHIATELYTQHTINEWYWVSMIIHWLCAGSTLVLVVVLLQNKTYIHNKQFNESIQLHTVTQIYKMKDLTPHSNWTRHPAHNQWMITTTVLLLVQRTVALIYYNFYGCPAV